MIVTVVPPIGEPYFYHVDVAEAELRWSVFGGPLDGRLPGKVLHSRRLRFAEVRVHLEDGRSWEGYAWNSPGDGEDLVCLGKNACLTLGLRTAMYCSTGTREWQERTLVGRNTNWSCQQDGSLLRIIYAAGQPTGTGGTGFWRTLPETGGSRTTFAWRRPSNYTRLSLYHDTYAPNADTGAESASLTEAWAQEDQVGLLTGNASVDVDATHDLLLLLARTPPAVTYTPEAAESVFFSSVKVFGVDGVTDTTLRNIVLDVLEHEASVQDLPAGEAFRLLVSNVGTAIQPIGTTTSNSGADKIAEALPYEGAQFGWRRLRMGTRAYYVPRLAMPGSTPRWVIDVRDSRVRHSLAALDLEDLVTHVEVGYHSADGRPLTTVRQQADMTAYLRVIGREKWAKLPVATDSLTRANAMGDLYLAEHARDRISGTITTPYLQNEIGGRAPLCRLREGDMVRVAGMRQGGYTVRVTEVALRGGQLTLTVDSSPYALEIALAKLSKREAGRAA